MKHLLPTIVVALAVGMLGLAGSASAHGPCSFGYAGGYPAQFYPWHAGYYHAVFGVPVALVVPPTAELQTHWSWGVPSTRVSVIGSQFHRDYPGPPVYVPGTLRPTPRWPSSTDQFGVYYVRGPW